MINRKYNIIEQITSSYIMDYLKSNEIQMASTHAKLCTPTIRRICHKMRYGIKFGEIKVCDDMIIDGHHRYVSSLITNYQIDRVPGMRTSATKTYDWRDIEFDENDWDTLSRINYLNSQDAAYNNIGIETLKKLTGI